MASGTVCSRRFCQNSGRQWEKAKEHYQTALRQAHELLSEAIAMYTTIGMPKHVEMADEIPSEV